MLPFNFCYPQATTDQQSEAAISFNPSSIISKMTASGVVQKELAGARVMKVFSDGPFDEEAALAVLGSHQIGKESANESTHMLLRSLIGSGIIIQQGTLLQLAPNILDDMTADEAAELRYLQYYIFQLGQAVNLYESVSFSSGLTIIDGGRVHFNRILFEMNLPASILLDLLDALILGFDCLLTRWTEKQISAFYDRVQAAVETDVGKQLVEHDLILCWAYADSQPDLAIELMNKLQSGINRSGDNRAKLTTAWVLDRKFVKLKKAACFKEALLFADKLLPIRIELFGENHTETAKSFDLIGNAHDKMGNYDLALDYYNKALDVRKLKLGDNHVSTGDSYSNIGNVYQRKGSYDLALEYHKKSLAIDQAVLGEKHTDTAASYNNIGAVYQNKGDYDLALENYEKSLAIQQAVLGEQHTSTATSYNNIGSVYRNKGDDDLALEYHKKSLAIKQEVLGEQHTSTALSYNNIGSVYQSKGDYDLALEYLKKDLAITLSVLGEKHTSTATSYNNIGMVYNSKGDDDLALEYYQKSVAIWQTVLGEKHSHTATSYNNIGMVYKSKGDYDLALEYLEKALSIRISIFDEDHPDVALSLYNMAFLYKNMNNLSSARECAQKAFDMCHRRLGPDHGHTKRAESLVQSLASATQNKKGFFWFF